MNPVRVGFVTQWYPPEPAAVPSGIAEGLAARGHEIHVLTGFPNYPGGKVLPGYTVRPYRRERLDDRITVHRAPLIPGHDSSGLHRAVNYLSFAVGATSALPRIPRPDVWLTYSSPVTATMPALASRLWDQSGHRRPIPHAQIIQDLWPDSVLDSGLLPEGAASCAAKTALDRYCSFANRRSAAIGIISPSMRGLLTSRGVPDHVIVDTPNWVRKDPVGSSSAENRRELGLPMGKLFLYAGNLGEMQALPEIVDAFSRVPEAQLVIMGAGVARPRVAAELRRRRLTNVHLLAPVSPDQVDAYVSAADVLVVSLSDTPLLRATMPSKVQTSLAAGRAIFAHAAGDAAEVIRSAGCGAAAEPSNPESARAAIARLAATPDAELHSMGASGRRYFERHFAPDVGLDALERLLTRALSTMHSPPS